MFLFFLVPTPSLVLKTAASSHRVPPWSYVPEEAEKTLKETCVSSNLSRDTWGNNAWHLTSFCLTGNLFRKVVRILWKCCKVDKTPTISWEKDYSEAYNAATKAREKKLKRGFFFFLDNMACIAFMHTGNLKSHAHALKRPNKTLCFHLWQDCRVSASKKLKVMQKWKWSGKVLKEYPSNSQSTKTTRGLGMYFPIFFFLFFFLFLLFLHFFFLFII